MNAILSLLACCALAADAPVSDRASKAAWQTPVEVLTRLAEQDGIRWALPETVAGRAFVNSADPLEPLLDKACKQWGLVWMRAGGVIVVHKANDKRLGELTTALKSGDRAAAWELGWLRDGRAIGPLAEALRSDVPALALAAAQAIEVLDLTIPLGRDEAVDPLPKGRMSLSAAFTPAGDFLPLLASPYPPVRATALRLARAQGGDAATAAIARTTSDRSAAVLRVLRETPRESPPEKQAEPKTQPLLDAPEDAAELKAVCDKLVSELPALETQSEWEKMRWRVRTLAAWSREGRPEASEALLALMTTRMQFGWFPGYVQMHLAGTGDPAVFARLKELMPKADRDTLVRGLEQSRFGDELLAFTRPFLDEQTLCYVTARKAGREAIDDLLPLAQKGNFAAIDSLGVIGGPEAVKVLIAQLNRDDFPEPGTLAFRSAKALGRARTVEALDALLLASASENRFRAHAATLFLGQIGGPKAIARLQKIAKGEAEYAPHRTDRLILAAAADALEQIGDKESQPLVAVFRRCDAGLPPLAYRPRNPRFGKDFPVNEWVNLKLPVQAHAAWGEMGWNYDAANRLFFRYGGCSGYTNELTVFDLGTEQFTQRRPNEEMAGWGDRRSARGCSGGRCWDPHQKLGWIGPVIGGSDADLAIAEYYNHGGGFRLTSYDLATDRFEPAPYFRKVYGEPSKRYAYDWKNGLLILVTFSPFPNEKPFWVVDTRTSPYDPAGWLDRTTKGDYPREQGYPTAAVDQASGLLVLYIPPRGEKGAETWTCDPATGVWKNMGPKTQPQGVPGGGLVYDPFRKVLLLQSGKKETQFGGRDDSITWTYDVRTNTWTDLAPPSGPGNPWVGAIDFDPEHNVFVLFNNKDRQVWAYRSATMEP